MHHNFVSLNCNLHRIYQLISMKVEKILKQTFYSDSDNSPTICILQKITKNDSNAIERRVIKV